MHKNEEFLKALRYMNTTMKADIKAGHQWRYTNNQSKKVVGFNKKRKQGKYYSNCVDGVQDALLLAGIPASALHWYGTVGEIAWTKANGKEGAKKYFDIIKTGGKTVKQLYKDSSLCDGDILLGFQNVSHTCAYIGNGKSFDSGHTWCSPRSGNEAKYKKWIGSLTCKTSKVNYILRLKDRAHYRVQAGAFTNLPEYTKNKEMIEKKGFPVSMVKEDNMLKIQLGFFSGKTNADRFAAKVAKKGISVFVKEIS